MAITIGIGAYWEGFKARGEAHPTNPYTDTDRAKTDSWDSGLAFASRTCSHCGASTFKDLIEVRSMNVLASFDPDAYARYGLGPGTFICKRCQAPKMRPVEHTVYSYGPAWRKHLRRALEFVHRDHDESPFRVVSYYGLPQHRRDLDVTNFDHYHAFTIVTNGDRYDIKNPHISEDIKRMVSFTREQMEQIAVDK